MPTMPRPLLLGHRGARATRSIPENTVASFDLALAHGCDGFEFDVRRTADGRAVISHDPAVQGVEIGRAGPADLTGLSELDQILMRYKATAFLDIELKVAGLERSLLKSLRFHPPQKGYVVTSFLKGVLHALRGLDDHIRLGFLCETRAQLEGWNGLPVQYILPQYTLMDIELIRVCHGSGRKVIPWTVNHKESMLQFRDMGVDGLISDDTETLAQLRQQ
jgi:glycerophosphoryl diester phosphodiesterase